MLRTLILSSVAFWFFFSGTPALATHQHPGTNILDDVPSTYNHWAWNDVIGWIDFQYSANPNVMVSATNLSGYANSSVGFIALDCSKAPDGSGGTVDICDQPSGTGNWFVSNADNNGQGVLAGWAWNDAIGWISFCGDEGGGSKQNAGPGGPWSCSNKGSLHYGVTIDQSGDFHGWAWNDVIGWISFNCIEPGSCGSVDYKVKSEWVSAPTVLPTAELTSNIFDTCPAGTPANVNCGRGAANALRFQGVLNGGNVRFQVASSDDIAGPWTFIGPTDAFSYYSGLPGASIPLTFGQHNNKRYLRYKVFLDPCNPSSNPPCSPPQSPVVQDVIINWSP